MATLKELHDLIHSLDKNEKRHISLLIEALGGKARDRYAETFSIFNKQKEFNADKLKQKLEGQVSGMSLTEANNYVYDFICKAILGYLPGSTLGYTNQLYLAEIFINKKLLTPAHKLLQDLMLELEEKGTHAQLLRAYELQAHINLQHPKLISDYNFRDKFFENRTKLIDNIQQNISLAYLMHRFYKAVKEVGQPRTKEQLKIFEKMWQHPVLQVDVSQIEPRSVALYYVLKLTLASALYKEGIYESCKLAVYDFQKRFASKKLAHAEANVLDILVTHMITKPEIEHSELMWAKKRVLELLPDIPQKAVRQQRYAKIVMAELSYYLNNKQYKKGIAYYEQMQTAKEKDKWGGAILNFAIPWLGARLYYLDKNPDKALDCLLSIQEQEKTMRPNVLIEYKFLAILCHYKLENHTLVTSAADSLHKFLRKQETLYDPEKAVLKFIKSSGSIQKMKSNMQELYNTLLKLNTNVLHRPFFQFGDYLTWLKAELDKGR
jgi:hypothetical protein